MSRAVAWLCHASVVLAGATGVVYGWMRYLAEPEDEFAIVNHPWQPSLQHAHVLVVPLLVFACGLIWQGHVWGRLRQGVPQRRRTGVLLAFLLPAVVVSGYLIQVAADEGLRTASIWLHGVSSTAWLALYAGHQLLRDRVPALAPLATPIEHDQNATL